MNKRNHLLRDVLWLTLPVGALAVYLVVASLAGFWNSEIRNFHGQKVGSLRVSSYKQMLFESARPFVAPLPHRYKSRAPLTERERRGIPVFDLRIPGTALDTLNRAYPGTAKLWQQAELVVDGMPQEVRARFRGQRMGQYFHRRKAWKIRTERDELVDGYRIISLTPLAGRLEGHLSFEVARAVGLPAPRSRVVRYFVNLEDQGLYLQEEQIDESMMRRIGRMPGDVFYGEAVVPEKPPMSSNKVWDNPYLWDKKAAHNRYPAEHRPYLEALLDRIHDDAPASFDELQELLDGEVMPLYFALLAYQGDQHIDDRHNQKYYFNPLSGRFEPVLWNPLVHFSDHGVESVANTFFRKLARDPRFLDRVHALLYTRMFAPDLTAMQLDELERIEKTYVRFSVDPQHLRRVITITREALKRRRATLARIYGTADLRWDAADGAVNVHARAPASLRLTAVRLAGDAAGVRLFEDRNANGELDAADRELAVAADGDRLAVTAPDALVYTGRDFSASYQSPTGDPGTETFNTTRDFTRLAYLESRYLVVARSGGPLPRVTGIEAARTVGEGPVDVRREPPDGFPAPETAHPWTLPAPPAPVVHRFSGEVALREDLVVRANDRIEAAPGTVLRLGPGVSILSYARVDWRNVTVRRLQADRPWGVFALNGAAADKSRFRGCRFEGGSHDELRFVYYSGMFSVHGADGVVVEDSVFADNVLGDDTVRFGACADLLIRGVRVEGANGDAIDCDISTGRIEKTVVVGPRNDGIDLMTAIVHLDDIEVTGAGDKGVSFGEGASPNVSNIRIRDCMTGFGLKDSSHPIVRNAVIEGCGVALSSYDKNWRYPGGGRGHLIDSVLRGNAIDVRMDARSTLTLERCRTDGRIDLARDNTLKEIDPVKDAPE